MTHQDPLFMDADEKKQYYAEKLKKLSKYFCIITSVCYFLFKLRYIGAGTIIWAFSFPEVIPESIQLVLFYSSVCGLLYIIPCAVASRIVISTVSYFLNGESKLKSDYCFRLSFFILSVMVFVIKWIALIGEISFLAVRNSNAVQVLRIVTSLSDLGILLIMLLLLLPYIIGRLRNNRKDQTS